MAQKAVLLSFRLADNAMIHALVIWRFLRLLLLQTKFAHERRERVATTGVRVVPPAARRGSYLARNVVPMPLLRQYRGYVDEGTMVDTWATVGSRPDRQNVHLSGGVGIGGVLEPIRPIQPSSGTTASSVRPLGSGRGCIVEENSVLGMGVYIGKSTKIYNRATGEISYGRVPAGSVVVSGSLPSADGSTTCTAL